MLDIILTNMKTNLELYKVFYETASLQSVTAAAEKLFITQPAVSQSIKNLEESLGTALFVRKPRGMELTKAGSTLFQYVSQAYALLEKGEQHLRELGDLGTGEFIISAGDTICRHILLPIIERFHHQYPGIQVRVTNRTTTETVKLLKDGRADLGILALPLRDGSLEYVEIMKVRDCFICGEKYRDKIKQPASLEEISKYPLLLLESGTITRKTQDEQFGVKGLQMAPEIELGSLDLLVEFAKIGLGIACVPREFFLKQIKNKEVYEIELDSPLPTRSFAAARHRSVPQTGAGAAFMRLLKEYLPPA